MSKFWDELKNPINLVLIAAAAFVVYQYFTPQKPIVIPKESKKEIIKRDFTPKQLAEFSGENGSPIYLAIDGNVYDVSSKPEFYGPGSMYSNFSGRDASRGMAKNSFDLEMITPLDQPIDKLNDLNSEETESLKEWGMFFQGKYPCVGRLVDQA